MAKRMKNVAAPKRDDSLVLKVALPPVSAACLRRTPRAARFAHKATKRLKTRAARAGRALRDQ